MTPARRAATALSLALSAHAGVGLFLARDLELTAAQGAVVASVALELGGASFNPLGALIALGVALIGLLGALIARPLLLLASAAGHILLGVQVLLQFGRAENWLGSRGSNLSLAIAATAGLAAAALAMRHDARGPQPHPETASPSS